MHRYSTVAWVNAAVLTAGVLAAGLQGTAPPAPRAASTAASPVPAPVAVIPAQAASPSAAPRTTVRPTPAPRVTMSPPAPTPRKVMATRWRPYAAAGPVVLHFPGSRVEVVGLHQSGNDGALPQVPTRDAGRIGTLDSRARGTNGRGAADIVMDPTSQVRAPVTGTVLRAGTYRLYCDHVDQYLVIEPDDRPGWEVKLLHITGLSVDKGERVRAGVTVVAAHARVLPFASQVDKHTAAPHWPHVHVEVVDPSVPDRPSGSTCS